MKSITCYRLGSICQAAAEEYTRRGDTVKAAEAAALSAHVLDHGINVEVQHPDLGHVTLNALGLLYE